MRALMRTRWRGAALWCGAAALAAACHKKSAAPALKDVQNDLLLLRTQLALIAAAPPPGHALGHAAVAQTALYTCERLAVAGKELADDARAQSYLGEADSLCSYAAPLALGEHRLAALEAAAGPGAPPAKTAPADCGPIRDALARVGAKYKSDPKLAELIKRFKTDCPRMRLASARAERASTPSSPSRSGPDPSAVRADCRRRCDDTAFDCRSRCQYCGSCTNDKTWEWCNATCNNCKQGCEQNERFCQASCGG